MEAPKIASHKRNAILAIYPHPKAIGYAIMNSPASIQESGCRYITAKDRTPDYLRFIESLIRLNRPITVIIESEQSRNKHRLEYMQYIFRQVEIMEDRLNHSLTHHSRKEIRKCFGEKNKPEIAQAVARKFEDLQHKLPKQRVSTDGAESPSMSEFDALSLCITHFSLT
jgi:hypothetical protein